MNNYLDNITIQIRGLRNSDQDRGDTKIIKAIRILKLYKYQAMANGSFRLADAFNRGMKTTKATS